jgi:hypothetical protein
MTLFTEPAPLPHYLEFRVGEVCLVRLPLHEHAPRGIPLAAEGWRLATDKEWREMGTLPKEWRKHLEGHG